MSGIEFQSMPIQCCAGSLQKSNENENEMRSCVAKLGVWPKARPPHLRVSSVPSSSEIGSYCFSCGELTPQQSMRIDLSVTLSKPKVIYGQMISRNSLIFIATGAHGRLH